MHPHIGGERGEKLITKDTEVDSLKFNSFAELRRRLNRFNFFLNSITTLITTHSSQAQSVTSRKIKSTK